MNTDYDWIAATLVNDESSSDQEMREHFIMEGEMSNLESNFYVAQRDRALRHPLQFNLDKYQP